jgi:hypothetical protein
MTLYGIAQVQNDFQSGGYYNAILYNDITSGRNDDFSANVGWDPVTGMGSFAKYNRTLPTTKNSPENGLDLELILGLSIGIGLGLLFICVAIATVVLLLVYFRSKHRKYSSRQSQSK